MELNETLDVVRDAAQMLTMNNKVLVIPSEEYPLAAYVNTMNVDEEPKPVEMTDDLAVAVEDHFEEVNEETVPGDDVVRDNLIENLATSLKVTTFTAMNVIIPAIKDMHQYYTGLQVNNSQPDYRVESFIYGTPHNNPGLVNHINTRYAAVKALPSYNSIRLNPVSVDQIIEMMAVNNPHMEQEEITEWALEVGSQRIESVWNSLFLNGGSFTINELPYLNTTHAPFNVDEMMIGYFICGHYMDNAADTPGQDITFEEWSLRMQIMHEMFGRLLCEAYKLRVFNKESGLLVVRNQATNPIETRRAVVVLNADVATPWLTSGGDIQSVLGACIDGQGIVHLEMIQRNAEQYTKRWHAVYPLMKQAAIDYADRIARDDIMKSFRVISTTGNLKERHVADLEQRLNDAISKLSRDDLRAVYKTFATLICNVYFPNSVYNLFLQAVDEYGDDFPDATTRELNTQALITVCAIFMAKQVKVELFTPDIDPNYVDENAIDDMDSGIIAVAMDETEAPANPGVEVEGVDVVGPESETVEEETDFSQDDSETEEDPYADLSTTTEDDNESKEEEESLDESEEETSTVDTEEEETEESLT